MLIKKMTLLLLIILGASSFVATDSSAVAFILRLGPAGVGFGGTNPMGLPPGIADMEVAMVTARNVEFSIGLPGIVGGYRAVTNWGGYVSAGGGIIGNTHGIGPGAYTAFGIDFGGRIFKMNVEYKQTIGLTSDNVISPHALRIGGGFWFH